MESKAASPSLCELKPAPAKWRCRELWSVARPRFRVSSRPIAAERGVHSGCSGNSGRPCRLTRGAIRQKISSSDSFSAAHRGGGRRFHLRGLLLAAPLLAQQPLPHTVPVVNDAPLANANKGKFLLFSPIKPSPPALLTADASSQPLHQIIPACTMGY